MFLLKSKNFLFVLLSATILAIPMPMLIILGGLAGQQLATSEAMATLPVSFQMLAGLFAVAPMSMFMGRVGRRIGFLTAAGFAFVGGLLAALSLLHGMFFALCIAHGLLGVAVVSFNLFRFAAAELVEPKHQSTAISITLGSGLVAAVLAPEVFQAARGLLEPIVLAGPYVALSALSLLGSVPLLFARFASPQPKPAPQPTSPDKQGFLKRPRLVFATLCGAGSAAGMTLLMTPTPMAMVGCGFNEVAASDVIRWHVVAMFAPSFVTGAIINRIGANRVAIIGALLMALSGVIALSGILLVNFYVSLVLLGVGWNFGFVGATAMLNAELRSDEKALYQGINDTVIALGGTLASFASGMFMAAFSWNFIAAILILLAGVVALSSLLQGRLYQQGEALE